MLVTREQIAEVLASTIERHPKAWPEERRVAMLAEWHTDISGFKLNDIEQALVTHRQQSGFSPKTADIIKIIRPKANAAKAAKVIDIRDSQAWKDSLIAAERKLEGGSAIPEKEPNGEPCLYAFPIPKVVKLVRRHLKAFKAKRPDSSKEYRTLLGRQWIEQIAWDLHNGQYKGSAE